MIGTVKRHGRHYRAIRTAGAVGVVTVALLNSAALSAGAAEQVDCSSNKVHCVDDTAGPMQEFDGIQEAVDRAKKGHTVVVAPGDYDGFRIARSGKKKKPIVVRAQAGARIVAPEARSSDGIYIENASYVVVEGFEVDGGAAMRFGIATHDASASKPMKGVQILSNEVHDAVSTNIYLSQSADSLIEGNVAYGSRASHGIYVANAGSDDTVVRANDIHDNAVNGIHFNGDASLGGDGVHTGLLVDGNRIWNNAANGIDADGVRDSTFQNNLVFDNGRHALRAFAIDAAAGPRRLTVVNNTFVDNGGWAVKLTQDDGGHSLFNNILLSDAGSIVVERPGGLLSDFNVVESAFSDDGEDTVLSLGEWQALGFDADSFGAKLNKLFQKPNKSDYHLRRKSPALDVGAAKLDGTKAPGADLDGVERPQGTGPDLGAYERPDSAREVGS